MRKNVISLIIVGLALILVSVGIFIAVLISRVPELPVHYHANFGVFINGAQVNFAKAEYMHLRPCRVDDDPSFHDRLENIHLHDMVGNVVHVHESGLQWKDLFSNLKYNFQEEATKNNGRFTYYLNDVKVDASVLDKVVEKNDRLLVTLTPTDLPEKVSDNPTLVEQSKQVGSNAADYDSTGKANESCSGNQKRTWQIRLRIALKRIFG